MFDGTEVDAAPSSSNEASDGFCISYQQYAC